MTKKDIEAKAKEIGVKGYTKMEKSDLIKAIQVAEGNSPCFAGDFASTCGIAECLWKADCSA